MATATAGRDALGELRRRSDVLVALGVLTSGLADDVLAEALRAAGPLAAEALVVPAVPALDAAELMAHVRQGSGVGYVDMRPVEPADFLPTADVDVPDGPYLLVDVDTGAETRGVAPRDALPRILAAGRSPLTLEEGVLVAALVPGILDERGRFQMLGSRRGDKRIASLWITRAGAPRLGWCFEGVPHSWLGAASCRGRVPLRPA